MLTEALVAISCVYCSISFVLLRWPTLLYKKKNSSIRATVVSHRGGCGECIENTIHAFGSSVRLGCDMLELDCQLTKDGNVVVSHDNDLSRATGVNKFISELNFDELPQYLDHLAVTFGFGQVCKSAEGISREIPLLRTVFENFPYAPVNIDVKADNAMLIKKISGLVDEFGRHDITVWGSFSDAVNRKCLAENPRIATFMPMKRTLKIILAYYMGLLPFMRISDGFFELPLVQNYGRMPNVVEYLKSHFVRFPSVLKFGFSEDDLTRFTIATFERLLMSKKLCDHMRARGIEVIFWVGNTEDDFNRAFSMGRVGVVTDYPSRLLEYLKRHPEVPRGMFSATAI